MNREIGFYIIYNKNSAALFMNIVKDGQIIFLGYLLMLW